MAATHTTNLGLNKPARGDFVSVVSDINDNMDKIDAKIGDLGEDSVADKFTGIDDKLSAQSTEISAICQTITGTTNNTGHTINSGEYFIANGGKYQATASIPDGQTWSDKSTAVSDNDIINALNSKLTSIKNQTLWHGTIAANSMQTDTVTLTVPAQLGIVVGFEVTGGEDIILSRLYFTSLDKITYRLRNAMSRVSSDCWINVWYL